MAPRTQSLLPKQTPAEMAEQRRRDEEDDNAAEAANAVAAARIDSNASQYTNDDSGSINAINWFGIGQNASGFPSDGMATSSGIGFSQGMNASWGLLNNQGFGESSFGLSLMSTNGFDSTGESVWRIDQY